MYLFGPTSEKKLITCNPKLIKIARKAIKIVDFSIVSGFRDKEEQDRYFRSGASKLQYPNSNHNTTYKGKPYSDAFDFQPYPNNYQDLQQYCIVAGIILGVGHQMGIKLRWGYDWDRDGKRGGKKDFNDLGHIELYDRRKHNKKGE